MNIVTIPTNELTMTSREIADACVKRHDHVMRDIKKLIEFYAKKYSPQKWGQWVRQSQYQDPTGRTLSQYELNQDATIDLITGYSIEHRHAVNQRWQELEQQVAKPDPMAALSDPAALRQILIGYTEKVIQLKNKVEVLEPKAQALNRLTVADGCMNPTVAAKNLQVRPKQLFDYLKQNKWIYRRAGAKHNSAYQEKIQQGLLKHKVTIVEREDGTEKVVEQVLVTAKGLAKLASIFTQETTGGL